MSRSRHAQRGIAAIEFAAVLSALFIIFYGVATFGAIFYTQQVISRAAEDGVRAVATLPNGTAPDPQRVRDVVYDSLASSLMVPMAMSQTTTSRRAWLAAHVQVAVATSASSNVTVRVSYRYSDNPLLPSIALLDASRWVPDQLSRSATIAKPT